MTEVGIAVGALDLDPLHPVAGVIEKTHAFLIDRFEEAWPTTAGVELTLGIEKQLVAADAVISASTGFIPVHA